MQKTYGVNHELKLAYIQNISYYDDCVVRANLDYPWGGGTILRLCIQFLKEMKEKYQIRRIQLRDNSEYTCDNKSPKIHHEGLTYALSRARQ